MITKEFEIQQDCQIKGLKEIYRKHLENYGTFVEIGANDGIKHSNTRALAELGWSGLLVEPIKSVYEDLRHNYKYLNRIQTARFAITNKKGFAYMNINEDRELSTMDPDGMNVIKDIGFFNGRYTTTQRVRSLTLDLVCSRYNIINIDLLIIDVEGHEHAVLEGFNNPNLLPKMAIIELHEESGDWLRYENTHKNIKIAYEKFKDYTILYKDEINTIFYKE